MATPDPNGKLFTFDIIYATRASIATDLSYFLFAVPKVVLAFSPDEDLMALLEGEDEEEGRYRFLYASAAS
jgi:hypothetical protein